MPEQEPVEVTVQIDGRDQVAGTVPSHLRLSTLIDFDDSTASIETALSVSGYFRLSAAEAVTIVGGVERATSHWRREAAGLGLPRQQVDRVALAYETPERQTAKALPYSGVPDIP
jgi:hypothetical protein